MRERAKNSVLGPKSGVEETSVGENWGGRSGVAGKSSARIRNNQKFLQKNFHGRATILRHLTDGGGPGESKRSYSLETVHSLSDNGMNENQYKNFGHSTLFSGFTQCIDDSTTALPAKDIWRFRQKVLALSK